MEAIDAVYGSDSFVRPRCAARAEISTGIDLVILLDCSKSMSDDQYGGTDKRYDRSDAAAMMINMCDAKESYAAVVPFTDRVETGAMFNRMLDMSDLTQRNALCNAVLDQNTIGSSSGLTKCGETLNKAYELLSQRRQEGSRNRSVVLLLSDGDIEDKDASRAAAINLKRRLDASVYCVFLNPGGGSNAFMMELAGTADSSGYEASQKYYRHGQSSDMVVFFSDIFAELIGSRKETREVQIMGDICVIPVDIPNGSIFETNLAFQTALIDSNSQVQILPPNSASAVTDSGMVHAYEYKRGAARGYDYYSVKLMDHPEPGEWKLQFRRAKNVAMGTRVSYDVLYNYEIQLAGSIEREDVTYNDTLRVTANFITPDGMPSNDKALYRALGNGAPAIPAVMTVEKEGQVVYEARMENDQDNLCYHTEINLNDVRGKWDYGEYRVRVHAEGDTLYRDLVEELSFNIRNTEPALAMPDASPMISCLVDNCFGDDSDGEPVDVRALFEDVDGDRLEYETQLEDAGDILEAVRLDDGILSVSPRSGARGTAQIYVTARDPAGASAVQVIQVRVESVAFLIEDGQVTAQLSVDEVDAVVCKGGHVRVNLVYALGEAVNGLFSVEDVQTNARVGFTVNGQPLEAQTDPDSGMSYCLCTFGSQEGTYDIEAWVDLAGYAIGADGISETVTNRPPRARLEEGAMDTERDLDSDASLEYDLSEVFEDEDTAVEGYEQLTYGYSGFRTVSTGDAWKRPAQAVLRLVGLKPKPGNEIELIEDEGALKRFRINDTGVYSLDFDVTDADSASDAYSASVKAVSHRETIMCIVVYGICLLILAIIAALLFNRFVVHQAWPHKGRPGSRMTGYRDKVPQPVNGKNVWDVDINGRKPVRMNRLYRFGDRQDPDYQAINRELGKIMVWPTTGERFVVELKDKINASITVDGKDLLKVKKAKWRNGTQMGVVLKLQNGNVIDLLWKRG